MSKNTGLKGSAAWKLLERAGILGIQFIVQIVMARILAPGDYGVLSVMLVFVAIAQVFVQSGLGSALIQSKEVEARDFSSVFYFNLSVSLVLLALLAIVAPLIESYYEFIGFCRPFRVLLLILPLGALSMVHIARLTRNMSFKKLFLCNITAVLVSGAVGIIAAALDCGIWALVWQQLTNQAVLCLALWLTERWKPGLTFSTPNFKRLFRFGYKLLIDNLVETIYLDIVNLIIGKKFSADMLAYYTRGKQFPNLAVGCIKETMQGVLLPAYSQQQEDKGAIREMMGETMKVSLFFTIPLVTALAIMARPLVAWMLTDKWLPCVPYFQIACVFYLFVPINTTVQQGVCAVGKSDAFLQAGLIKRGIAIVMVILATLLAKSLITITWVWALTGLVNVVVNNIYLQKIYSCSTLTLMRGVWPIAVAALVMGAGIFSVSLLALAGLPLLLLQFVVGLALYLAAMFLLDRPLFSLILSSFKGLRSK